MNSDWEKELKHIFDDIGLPKDIDIAHAEASTLFEKTIASERRQALKEYFYRLNAETKDIESYNLKGIVVPFKEINGIYRELEAGKE
jgi:hypothetical protein